MRDIATMTAVAATVLALAYNLMGLRRDRRAHVRVWMCVLFAGLTIGVAARQAQIGTLINDLGVPNLAHLLEFGGVLVDCLGCQMVLLTIFRPKAAIAAVRPLASLCAAVVVAYLGTFALADESTTSYFYFSMFAHNPWVVAHTLIAAIYTGGTFVQVMVVTWHCSHTHLPMQRWGLRTVALGAMAGLGYWVGETVNVIAIAQRLRPPGPDPAVVTVLENSILLCVLGVMLPALDPYLAAWRACRDIDPLWRPLAAVAPTLTPRTGIGLNPKARLYQRVIDIRDGQLALRPYLDRNVADEATSRSRTAGLDEQRTRATVEAAVIAVGLDALAAGHPPAQLADHHLLFVDTNSFETEVAWLGEIARAYTHSPIVATARRGSAPTSAGHTA
jgi:hypothetical protein